MGPTRYRDALCHEIARLVQQVDVDEPHVALSFDNGAVISISRLDKDYVGSDANVFARTGWWALCCLNVVAVRHAQ
jgi:hypothetical protein